ncbi:MAG: glycosyltransferase family 2 protein [Oscillospiraceae bacterium]|nr:glycosyltransferase family 2 protein [Oscillospiraceae bacterium]
MSLVNKKPLMTIIVPAYNVEKYLEQCLDSLVYQTIMDHRIIVVNDGSTDNTAEIIKKYINEYPELISWIDQENKGLGAARNRGLRLVETPFVTCIDSDDWQDQMFVERIKNVVNKYDEQPDIIFTLPWLYDSVTHQVTEWYDKDTFEKIFFPNSEKEDKMSIVTNARENKFLYELEASTNRRIYRTEFLRKIGFSYTEGKKWEDVKPHFHAIHHADRCIALKNTGFFYRVNTGGQITSGGGKSRLDIIPVFRDTLDMAFTEGWNEIEIAYILRMLWNFTTWSIDVTNTEYIGSLLKNLHELFNSIPYKNFKIYFKTCSPHRRKEMVKTWLLKSPFYNILKDYRVREYGVRIIRKLKRR